MTKCSLLASAALLCISTGAAAQSVKITEEMAEARFAIGAQSFAISRIQDSNHAVSGEYAKTSRDCPPFCIQPMSAGDGVETVGELEVISFLQNQVSNGTGLLIDARVPDWYAKGTIPGAVNVPFSTLGPESGYQSQILQALGASESGGGLDFSNALELTIFCNGPWCGQSHHAIAALTEAGYPPEKIKYYRGGVQNWLLLGLTIDMPQS